MSIINDALKKARQDSRSSGETSSEKPFYAEGPRKKSSGSWAPVFIVLVLLLVAAPVLSPIFSSPFRSSSSEKAAVENTAVVAPPASNLQKQFGIEESALLSSGAAAALPPGLNLTGVVYAANADSYCIINGSVLKAGDSVQGAKLVAITEDKVVLEKNGETIELPVE